MKIRIIETGENRVLNEIIDPRTGIEWTRDLLLNHGELPPFDDERKCYHMALSNYERWSDLIRRLQAADNRIHRIERRIFNDDRLWEFRNSIQSVDLEMLPDEIHRACNRWEEKYV